MVGGSVLERSPQLRVQETASLPEGMDDLVLQHASETDEDFRQTLSLLEEVRYQSSFSFIYAPRPGTPALKLRDRDPVDAAVASARLTELQKIQRQISLESNQSVEGKVLDVLIEGPSKHDEGVICGRSSTHRMVNFPGDIKMLGQTVPVRVTRAFTNSLRGELLVQ